MTQQSPVIDVHAHFIPDGYQQALAQIGLDHPDGAGIPPWSPSAHCDAMDALGIDRAVLSLSSPGVTPFGDQAPAWAQRANDQAQRVVDERPDRFGFFATLPLPDVDSSCREAARALDELGAAGIALLTHTQGVYLGDPRLDPLMRVLDERDATVFVHPTAPCGCEAVDMGRPAAFIEYLIDSTRAFVNLYANGVLNRYPGIHWIVAHNGALLPSLLDRVDLLSPVLLPHDDDRPCFAEAAAKLYYEIGSSAPFPRAAHAAAGMCDQNHLVLGTDYPYAPPAAIAANVAALLAGQLVTGDDLAKLSGANALAIMPQLSRSRHDSQA